MQGAGIAPRQPSGYRLAMKTLQPLFNRSIPFLFVFLWSTGWIVARYSADYADPLTFLTVRFALAGTVLLAFAVLARAQWPQSGSGWGHALFSGVLIHALYLGAVWWAIRQGVPASISALIAALQPILSALLSPAFVGERISPGRWAGVILGMTGLCLVLAPKLVGVAPEVLRANAWPMAINGFGMVAVTLGSFYQKRFLPTGDLRSITFLQYLGAIAIMLPAAFVLEPMRIVWNPLMLAVTAWSVLALSIGAIGLYLLLIRRGEVSRSAQLIYLVPPTAALQAWILFGETLSSLQIFGMAVTVLGVALASRK